MHSKCSTVPFFLLVNDRNPGVIPGLFTLMAVVRAWHYKGLLPGKQFLYCFPFRWITIIVSKHIMGHARAGSIIHIARCWGFEVAVMVLFICELYLFICRRRFNIT